MKKQLFFFFFLLATSLSAQENLRGYITDSLTGKPLAGAVVYFNATSIGTPANEEGYFELPLPTGLVSPLVVSFLGYEKVVLEEPFPQQPMHIRLLPATTELESVVLDARRKREQNHRRRPGHFENTLEMGEQDWYGLFEKIFLGEGEARRKTHISNREVLQYHYDPQTSMVSITANAPLIIENDYLKYRITYSLDTFLIQFAPHGERLLPVGYTSAGTSYFVDLLPLEMITRHKWKRTLKRREEAFRGSSFHFMRALAQNDLAEQGFEVSVSDSLSDGIQQARFQKQTKDPFTVVIPPEKFQIVHDRNRSFITARQGSFRIDRYGNHHPWDALKFEGYMGLQGMASAVPLNFEIEE